MSNAVNPAAPHHLPPFITAPGETDVWFNVMLIFLVLAVLLVVVFYFKLHSLPERIAHKGQKIQFELVAILALISLFTHNHLFWIAGLLLAFIPIPDLSTPLAGMADSLATMAGRWRRAGSAPSTEGIAGDRPDDTEGVLHPALEADQAARRTETSLSAKPAAASSVASQPASRAEPERERLAALKERA